MSCLFALGLAIKFLLRLRNDCEYMFVYFSVIYALLFLLNVYVGVWYRLGDVFFKKLLTKHKCVLRFHSQIILGEDRIEAR